MAGMKSDIRKGLSGNPQQQPLPWWRYLVWFAVVLLFSWYWFELEQNGQQQTLSYTAFKEKVRADAVTRITLQGERVSGMLRKVDAAEGKDDGQPLSSFVTTLPPVDDPGLLTLLEEHQVEVRAKSTQAAWWLRALIGLLPWILIIGLFWYAGRKMQERMGAGAGPGGIFGLAKSKAKRFREGESDITFDDVAGLENAKGDLREITGYLRNPQRYRRLGP